MSSYTSSPRPDNDDDLDNDDIYSTDEDGNDSDEDTEDASETEDKQQNNLPRTEIREQMYQDKLAHLKKQLQHLKEGTLPEYIKRNRRIEQQYRERLRLNEIWRDIELEIVEREHKKEKKASAKEFEEKKIELKESLIMDLEEKKRNVECERGTMDMNTSSGMTDFMEVKPIMTRKLRRRPNDPVPLPEKRRKPSPAQLNFFLDEQEIQDDLRIINKVSGKPINKKPAPVPTPIEGVSDVKIDDGKLYYDKRWFHRNQPVFVESKEGGKVCGVITGVGSQEIWVRKTSDNTKLRIYVSQLQKGKYILRRRST
ncbi:sin3 histone deacetylase corepressor complex component SDS3-like [Haliotis rubra]|uniref:sin3 histone deacetylase corepressor complex component SDS3-like n=1 Tax=Haliotis rubra TaxID=36100 RepID=UPI001EE539D4|nr:sin3 histone deacetylase corepressor complex component SDS3-like [Haliotis rubra]XP_048236705.1 sin3 histone deacetylase corepressor complex component SDS3-like isoform X2 [Haliotis rufescens]XP_048257123.1 sin3 histone deacetylase corepressor complex component SDS3-like isoform X2 [Haliotis rufescens]